jgi:hypothetical protein
VSTRFWKIISFAFHRLYATTTVQNAVYHQRQVILRNSTTPEGGIVQFLRLIWVNRYRRRRPDLIIIVIVGAVSVAGFAVAGGLSSQVSTAVGTEVLIQSLNCGYTNAKLAVSDDPAQSFVLVPEYAEKVNNAANYAQQCYSNKTAGTLNCGRFITKKLTSYIDNKATCPFRENICRSGSSNLRIDSGYIDSHKDLGHNFPVADRILTRNVLHCAPITTAGFTSQKNTSVGEVTVYHYGSSFDISGQQQDFVFAVKSIDSQYALTFAPDVNENSANYGVT